jgi:replicative DNA helicase
MFNLETEKIILSCLINSPSSITKIFERVKTEDFYDAKYRIIYDAIKSIHDKKLKINFSSLIACYKDYDVDCCEETVELLPYWMGGDIDYDINNLLDYSARRKLSTLLLDTKQLLQNKNYSIEKACFDVDSQLKVIADNKMSNFVSMKDMSTGDIQDIAESKRFYKTGFRDLDTNIHGIFCGELIILAARPKMGKSSLAGNIACYIAENHGSENVLFVSLEMRRNQLRRRFISQYAQLNSFILKTGNYDNEQQKQRATNAMKIVDGLPLFISDSEFELDGIINSVKRYASFKKISLLVVDYIQLINHSIKGANREQVVSEIGRNLKILAGDLNIPVLALSQLSRAVELRPDQKPILSDLRESGALEQHADGVWFIYQDKKQLEKNDILADQFQLEVAAYRDGKAGFEIDVTFVKEYTKFCNFMEA